MWLVAATCLAAARGSLVRRADRVIAADGTLGAGCSVALRPHGAEAKAVLTPLAAPSYKGEETAQGLRVSIQANVDFEAAEVRVTDGVGQAIRRTLYSEQLGRLAKGEHAWAWDGFDQAGVLDTRSLRGGLQLDLVEAGTTQCSLSVAGTSLGPPWLQARLDKKACKAEVEWRLQFDEREPEGVGTEPPEWAKAAGATLQTKPVRTFQQLKGLALEGIRKHWSRDIVVDAALGCSGQWHLEATGVDADELSGPERKVHMDDMWIAYVTNRDYGRSSMVGNASSVASFFGQLLFGTHDVAYYNVGWIRMNDKPSEWSEDVADNDFRYTIAHEAGHEILKHYGGGKYTGSHKGTSTMLGEVKPEAAGGEAFPKTGEVDVMKYYNRPEWAFDRLVAAERDAKALLWLTRLRF